MKPDSRKSIIIVGDFNRIDFLKCFQTLKNQFALFFIEFAGANEIRSQEFAKYGTAIFWKDFRDAFELIDKTDPYRVIFFFIESYNHVALNVACKLKNIRTIHLEHGIRDYERIRNLREVLNSKYKRSQNKGFSFRRVLTRLKTRSFFLKTIKKCPPDEAAFLELYFRVRSKHSIFETFEQVQSPYRVADQYISFSEKIFDFHRISDHLDNDYPVNYIGIPFFDEYANLSPETDRDEDLILIDQPFPEQELFEWTFQFRESMLREIHDKILQPENRNMWVKIHPLSNHEKWEELSISLPRIKLLRDGLIGVLKKNEVILGFGSTLLLPLMAQPHTVCFSLNIHPVENREYASQFVSTGAITSVDSIDELKAHLSSVEELKESQFRTKADMIRQWMYKFDGKATERFHNIIVHATS